MQQKVVGSEDKGIIPNLLTAPRRRAIDGVALVTSLGFRLTLDGMI
jgi:hypothetical protein